MTSGYESTEMDKYFTPPSIRERIARQIRKWFLIKTPEDIADRILNIIKEEVGAPCSGN